MSTVFAYIWPFTASAGTKAFSAQAQPHRRTVQLSSTFLTKQPVHLGALTHAFLASLLLKQWQIVTASNAHITTTTTTPTAAAASQPVRPSRVEETFTCIFGNQSEASEIRTLLKQEDNDREAAAEAAIKRPIM